MGGPGCRSSALRGAFGARQSVIGALSCTPLCVPIFAKDISRTWMSKSSHVTELDKLVGGRLRSTLQTHGRYTQPPIEFRFLVRQLVRHAEADDAFAVMCDCALLGELIFASARGEIYSLSEADDPQELRFHEPLLALRNACFHPGNVGSSPNLPGLIEALRMTKKPQLSERLKENWGLLSLSNDLARWALLCVNAVGRYELTAIGRWWPSSPS
jgi:hypothetical protein